jgi:hypothetical protein
MINAAPATPMASVNASRAWGHASGETAASWIVETREDMANRILKARLAEKNLTTFEMSRVDDRQTILPKWHIPIRTKSAAFH